MHSDERASHPRTTSEIARAVGVHPNTVRLYEVWGFLPPIPRDPRNGYRRYSPEEIDRLRIIRMLIRVGYSVMAVLRMLLQFDQGRRRGLREVLDTPRRDEDILSASDRWLSSLAEQEDRARRIVAQLVIMVNS